MQNPFSTSFGTEPVYIINRTSSQQEIIDAFTAPTPSNQVYMITGVRGSGKTVMLSSIANELSEHEDFIVVDLNSERDMIKTLTAELQEDAIFKKLIGEVKLSLNAPFASVSVTSSEEKITDESVELGKMLAKLTDANKRLLVTVDEVITNPYMKEFASQFQIFLRKKYNIFLLMAGLYDNINKLQNEKTLTFLYRAPRLELPPLNLYLIQKKYQDVFSVDDNTAKEMSQVTKGYPYAFQTLGYLCYKTSSDWKEVIPEFDIMLEDYSYEKIWSELSANDRKIMGVISNMSIGKVEEIRNVLSMSSNEFTVYRKRLIKKGILKSDGYGKLEIQLPRFAEFVNRNYDVSEEI